MNVVMENNVVWYTIVITPNKLFGVFFLKWTGVTNVLLEVDTPSGELCMSTWMIIVDEPIFEYYHAKDLILLVPTPKQTFLSLV